MKALVRNYDLFPSLINEFFNDNLQENNFVPSANIKENDDSFEIDLSLPGHNKEDFKIEINGRTLNISSEINKEEEDVQENYIRKEFSHSSFNRSFRLPRTADIDRIDAVYENGILMLKVAKKEEAIAKEPRLISIN